MDDKEIIELYFARNETAISETDKKYGSACHRISENILGNSFDADECVNDAYLGVWNAIPPAHPNPLSAFIFKITRNISLNRFHANAAAKRNSRYNLSLDELEECIADRELGNTELTAKIFEEFLDRLGEENRVIFMRRYWFSDSYEDIAKQVGLNEKAVSMRLVRARNKLRDFLAEKGIIV